jgi:hypothetical protein
MTHDEMTEPIKAGDKLVMISQYGPRWPCSERNVVVVDKVTTNEIVVIGKLGRLRLSPQLIPLGFRSPMAPDLFFEPWSPEAEEVINQEHRDRAERRARANLQFRWIRQEARIEQEHRDKPEREKLAGQMREEDWNAVDIATLRRIERILRRAGGFARFDKRASRFKHPEGGSHD